jgi:hypothetical protein
MHGFIRQLFDYDGSNLFPRTRPDAFVSCLYDSNAVGIPTIGELIDTSYMDPSVAWETEMGWEPEFIYRVNHEQAQYDSSGYGSLKAAKISQIPGLKFDAILKDPLPVSNVVGIAGTTENSPGGVYPVGTSLELIIREMLTAGVPVKDVVKHLPGCTFTVTIDGVRTAISNGAVLEYTEGAQYQLNYGYQFSDGYFDNPAGYALNDFVQYNNTGSNIEHFRNNKLYADVSILSIQVLDGNVIKQEQTNPAYEYSSIYMLTVESGSHTYYIKVNYSAMKCQPYKSDGSPSNKSIDAGSFSFMFTINSMDAFDVIPHDPSVGNTVLNIGGSGSEIEVKSQYDVSWGASTGIWVGDTVELKAEITRLITDGYFTPDSSYDTELFNSNNSTTNGVLNAGNPVNTVQYKGGNMIAETINTWHWPIGNNNAIKIDKTANIPNVASDTSVYFYINYGNSTVVPKKSNNSDSTVIVPSGTFILEGHFNASTDRDVSTIKPAVSIYEVVLNGGSHQYGDTNVSGYVNFYLYDGYYKAGTYYNDTDFYANNPNSYISGSLHRLDASCLPFDASCIVNGTSFSVSNIMYSSTNHYYHGTGYFNGITLGSTNTFKINVSYGNSTVTANKLSGRPSNASISASTASDTSTINYTAPVPEYHYVMVTTNIKNTDSMNFSSVEDLLTTEGYITHLNESTTNTPSGTYSKTISPEEHVGPNRKLFVIAAPVYYTSARIYVDGNDYGVPFVLIPASGNNGIPYSSNSTDNIKYRLFEYKSSDSPSAFIVNKLELD